MSIFGNRSIYGKAKASSKITLSDVTLWDGIKPQGLTLTFTPKVQTPYHGGLSGSGSRPPVSPQTGIGYSSSGGASFVVHDDIMGDEEGGDIDLGDEDDNEKPKMQTSSFDLHEVSRVQIPTPPGRSSAFKYYKVTYSDGSTGTAYGR